MDILSHLVSQGEDSGIIEGHMVGRKGMRESHLQLVDDNILLLVILGEV